MTAGGSHNLAITKASLAAVFMQPDPVSTSREEITRFHELLDLALKKCSSHNIEQCKEWLLKHHVDSQPRSTALGKHLVALSTSFKSIEKQTASGRSQQLHVLYILNDLLHHLKYHARDDIPFKKFVSNLQPVVIECVGLASAYDKEKFPQQKSRIDRLLQEWSKNEYFGPKVHEQLKQAARAGNAGTQNGTNGATNLAKRETPYIMPGIHGDPSAPYHELPAGNMMPHITPNTSIPIDPRRMRALQFAPGPAEPALVEAVKSFLQDVDLLYSTSLPEDEAISLEMDELGQNIVRDRQSKDVLSVETYYGWSKEFCERMKKKLNGRPQSRSRSQSRSSSRSRSRSRSRSQSPRKRPRLGIEHGSRSRSRRRSYSRSPSRSRSPRRTGIGRPRSYSRSRSRTRQRSGSRSRSRSRSPRRYNDGASGYSRPLSPGSRIAPVRGPSQQYLSAQSVPEQPPAQQYPHPQQVSFPPPPPSMHHNSIPPPPPPATGGYHGPAQIPMPPVNWQGPWPPPPPPPTAGHNYGNHQAPYHYQQPHYPPPPDHHHHHHHHHQQHSYQQLHGWQGMPVPPPPPPPPPPPQHQGDYHGPGYGYSEHNGYGRGQPDGWR